MTVCNGFLIFGLVMTAGSARAQEVRALVPDAPPGDALAPAQDLSEPAWTLYHKAFSALARNDRNAATAQLREIVAGFPEHPAAARARLLLPWVDKPDASTQTWRPGQREQTNGLARAELASYQTLHGIALAIEMCGLANCDDPSVWAAALLAGGGIGLGASLGLTTDGIRPGQALLYDSATSVGFFNGLAIWGIADLEDEQVWGILMGSQLAGLGAGIAAYHLLEPSDGAVSLANSGALWTGLLSVFFHGMNSFDADGDTIWATSMLAVDAGMAAGAAVANFFPMSRGRTLIIDSGGMLGLLTGMGLAVILRGSLDDERTAFGMAAGGTVAGLALATWLSADWDGPDIAQGLDASLTVVPVAAPGPQRDVSGAQALFSLRF